MEIYTDNTLTTKMRVFLEADVATDKQCIAALQQAQYFENAVVVDQHLGTDCQFSLSKIIEWLKTAELTIETEQQPEIMTTYFSIGVNAITLIAAKKSYYCCVFKDGSRTNPSESVIEAVVNAYKCALALASFSRLPSAK